VLLLEAGPDYPADRLPPDIANGWEVAYAHDWGFVTEPDAAGRSINAWRGRLVGGCSALNATIALRGHPRDYDRWAELGNPGWSFVDVLPFFRRLESDADFHTGWHGADGLLPIRRYAPDELTPPTPGFWTPPRSAAPTWRSQPRGSRPDGSRNTRRDGMRMSCALTFLAEARASNLDIRVLWIA
jgi:choline dehydrogenase